MLVVAARTYSNSLLFWALTTPTTGFHSEWITVGSTNRHRILLECRASFPAEDERFIASVAVELVDRNSSGEARVLSVYYDDKSCMHNVVIASTNEDDRQLENALRDVLQTIFGNGNPQVDFVLVAPGDTGSDHYDHMEHLSVAADVAVDRWKHRSGEYMATVSPPN